MEPKIFQVSWYETLKSPMSSCPNVEQIRSFEWLFNLVLLVAGFSAFRSSPAHKLQTLDERTIWGGDIPGYHNFT